MKYMRQKKLLHIYFQNIIQQVIQTEKQFLSNNSGTNYRNATKARRKIALILC